MKDQDLNRAFRFTKKAIASVAATVGAKQVYYSDTQTKYLRLSVGKAGTKTFIFYKKIEGIPRRLELGRFPDMTIEQARGMVGQLLSRIARGDNPFDEGIKAREEKTVEDLFNEYIERHAKKKRKTWQVMQKDFARTVPMTLRKRKAMQISSTAARDFHSRLTKERGPYAGNRAVQLLRAVFNKAIKYGLFEGRNPFADVELTEEAERQRFLSEAEARKLFQVLQESDPVPRDFIMLCLFTGARKANVLAMRFEDVDLDGWTWTIGAAETKTRSKYVIALGAKEMEIINRRRNEVAGEFVFPGTGKTGHLVDPKKAWTTIRKKAGIEDVTIHDLRRSLGAALASANVNVALIKGSLNHRDLKTTMKHYAFSNKDAERAVKQRVHKKWMSGKSKRAGSDFKSG